MTYDGGDGRTRGWPEVGLRTITGTSHLAAARRDLAGNPGGLSSRWLVYAGEVSFCFYLAHELVIVNLRPHMTGPAAVPIALIGSCVLAVALHHLVELPAQKLLRPAGKPPIGSEGGLIPVRGEA